MAQTVRDVLARHRVSLNEEDVAVALECALMALSAPAAAPLTAAEIDYLTEHADPVAAEAIKSWNPQSEYDERAAAAATASSKVLGSTLGIDECAEKLGVDRSRISHRISAGVLYSFTAVGTRRRIPAWQFVGEDLLPGLGKVVRAIPAGAHPLDVSALMTTRQSELADRTPVEHLTSGGNPQPVVELLGALGRW